MSDKKRLRKDDVLSQALWLVGKLWQEFPGLSDGESEINGGDLVEALAGRLEGLDDLRDWLRKYVEVGE